MPEDKPWESYSKPVSENKAPWDEYAQPKLVPRITDFGQEEPLDTTDKVDSAVSFLKEKYGNGNTNDDDFNSLKSVLADERATNEQRKTAIDAIQKKSMNNDKYSFELHDNGVSVPTAMTYGKKPKDMQNIQSIWGSQDNANDDNFVSDIAKHAFNIMPSLAQNAIGVAQLGYEAVADKDSEYLNELNKSAEYLKFKTDDDLKGGIYDFSKVKSYKDLTNLDNFDLHPAKIWGTALQLGQVLGEIAIPAGAISKGIKGAEWAYKIGANGEKVLSTAGKIATAGTTSFLVNAPEVADAADKAGLTGRDKAFFVSTVGAAISAVDVKLGLGGKLAEVIGSKALNKEASDSFLINMAKKAIVKNADGTIAKESLEQAVKETIQEYPKQISSWIANTAKDANVQGVEEAGQAIIQKAGEQAWDKLNPQSKAKFGTEVFSPQSIGEYISNYSAGAIGGGIASPILGNEVSKEKEKYFNQSQSVFNAVKKGPDAITNLKNNLKAAVEQGDITQEQHDQAVFKIDSYDKYNEQTKDLPNLTTEQKKDVFEKSFNIEALKSEIDFTPEELQKLDPIAIAKIDNKKEIIKGLQKDINHIILTQDIQNEPKVGESTVDKVAKATEPKKPGEEDKPNLEEVLKRFPAVAPEGDVNEINITPKTNTKSESNKDAVDFEVNDTKSQSVRPIDKFTTLGWNTMRVNNPLRVNRIIGNHLKDQPNHEMVGYIRTGQNKTLTVDIGDNKQVSLAQSVDKKDANKPNYLKRQNLPGKLGKYIEDVWDKGGDTSNSEGEYNFKYKEPVIIKRIEFPSKNNKTGEDMTKRVLGVYNPENGGFIGFIREHLVGKSNYSKADEVVLNKIQNANYKRNEAPTSNVVEKISKGQTITSKEDLQTYENNKSEIEKELKEKVKKETPKQREVTQVKVSEAEKDNLLNEGYDNATIDKAVKESNDIRKLPAKEIFNKLKAKGIFNLGTTGNLEFRPNVGLTAEEYNNTLKQLEKGKETKTAEKLMNFIEDIKETGQVSMIGMTGGKSEKYNMPLHQFLLENQSGERGLSEQEEKEKLAELETKDAYESQLQKKTTKGDFSKVLDVIKKNLPKVKVVLDNKIKSAGQVKGNVLSINPDYAGLDTPIHEAGHILIDSIGYNNKVIQVAIKQLSGTKLWADTKELYPELNEEMLGKEVLAQAIGVEGAGIFDKESDKSKFKTFLDYIFNKLKQLFGIDKNIAKSLSKQVISGIGTKGLEGKNEVVQESRNKKGMSEEEKYVKKLVDAIKEEADLNKFSNEQLVEIQNAIMATELSAKKKNEYLGEVMKRIALNLKAKGLASMDKKLDEDDIQKDISWTDKFFKVLSHFSDSFPEMKEFSKIWDSAYFAKMKESKAEKHNHDKLALDVVNDRNKSLGLAQTASRLLNQVLSENRHDYFGFLDNGKGKLITLAEAKNKKLSPSQIKYLEYTREKLVERYKIKTDIYDADMDVLRMDKKFNEAFKSEGIIGAVGTWLGTGSLSNIQLNFTNPNTGKSEKTDFVDIQNALAKYAEKGLKEKAEALILLFKYTIKAGKKKVRKGGEYLLDENGNLRSKFDKPVDSRKGYSKDFYSAMNTYIDDSAHIKHISPLIPIVNSIEYLNSRDVFNSKGELIGEEKKNLTEWIDKWRKLHVLGQSEEIQPELDKALKLLRFMTSAMTMWFNMPANILNVAIGNYNTIRDQSFKEWAIGQKRLFGGADRKYGVLNKYAYDLANKYIVVSGDSDSNPIQTGKGLFAKLAYLGQSWGEFQIQTSGLFGLMDEKDFNSFEYKKNSYGVEELVVKEGIDEKALEGRILDNINKVSDVQGKYGDKDKRNVMNNELGKAAMIYKVWMPDAWRVRYGSTGSWSKQLKGGFSEMRKQIKSKGFMEALVNGKDTEEVKDFKRNLKGLMATGLLISLTMGNDDDDKKTFASKMFQKALSDVLFVFEPDNLKFTIKNPSAVIGTLEKLINFGDHLFAVEADDFYKGDSKYGNEGDSKLRGDAMGFVPGKKVLDMADMLNNEE